MTNNKDKEIGIERVEIGTVNDTNIFEQKRPELVHPFEDERAEMLIYVGKRISLKTDGTYITYSDFYELFSGQHLFLNNDREDRVYWNNYVLKFDEDVFKRLEKVTMIDEHTIDIGIDPTIIRGMRFDCDEMVNEYEIEPKKIKSMIVDDVKYRALHR